jgi:hypothetical protein
LICSQCGHAELACRDCKGTHIVVDSKGLYCVGCRKRPGEPDPPRPSRTEPAPSPPSRHHLGEPAPPFPCPACNHQGWIEGIYSWRCRQCQHIAMKPEGPWPERI